MRFLCKYLRTFSSLSVAGRGPIICCCYSSFYSFSCRGAEGALLTSFDGDFSSSEMPLFCKLKELLAPLGIEAVRVNRRLDYAEA